MKSFLIVAAMGSVIASDFCPTMHADFLRRQALSWNSTVPFTEAKDSKHTPYLTVTGSTAKVVVGCDGCPYHPVVASSELDGNPHFITHIYVLDQDEGFVTMEALDPSNAEGGIAQIEFSIPEGTTRLTPYSFCNLHGLYVGPTVNVPKPGAAAKTCGLTAVAKTAWTSVVADLRIQQSWPPFNESNPYDESGGAKHTPYITLNGKQATVKVGDGKPYHPMVASADPDVVHWITHIYVLDQDGNLVTCQELDPDGVSVATIQFIVPSGTTSLTAYEWCNKHGLWRGPTVTVSEEVTTTGSQEVGGSLGRSIVWAVVTAIVALGC